MKKLYLLALTLTFGLFYAQDPNAGIWDAYMITQNPMQNNGDLFYHHAPDWNGADLGVFTKDDQMYLRGGQIKTFKNNGADITGADMKYIIYAEGNRPAIINWNTISLPWTSDDNSTPGNQMWEANNSQVSLVSGLENGIYNVEVFFVAHSSLGDKYFSNNGSNYIASFTIDNSSLAVSNSQNPNKDLVVNGQLHSSKKGALNLSVYDYSGRVLKSINMTANGSPIDLGISQRGQYILVISGDDGQKESIKFVQ